jgi:hypothetical protein
MGYADFWRRRIAHAGPHSSAGQIRRRETVGEPLGKHGDKAGTARDAIEYTGRGPPARSPAATGGG